MMIETIKYGLRSAALIAAIAAVGCDRDDTARNTGTGDVTANDAGDLARDTGDAAQREMDDAQTAAARAGAAATQPAGGLIGDSSNAAEKQFILTAASLVTFEEKAAELVEDKAADDATKQLADRLEGQNESFGDELKRIATRMNVSVPTELSPEHQRLLDELKNTPPEQMSKKFRQVMQEAYQQTISLYHQALKTVQTPELKEHVTETLPILQQHLQELLT